ncbi:hypothetical protein FKW77_007072 [Venturia effusa]|uniref:Uncharacterized protein n=1 Tax=Venturia effusa TaxID=50376 RepID=A0A517LE42_9PEZI|nr:hypothetical protein FKW77_007072 [Venturia effusa]
MWFRAIFKAKSLKENCAMVDGASKAYRLWRGHKKMVCRNLYLTMLTTFLEGVSGVEQFQGFHFLDNIPLEATGLLHHPIGLVGIAPVPDDDRWVYLPSPLEKTTRLAFNMEICFAAMRATNTSMIQGLREPSPYLMLQREHLDLRQLADTLTTLNLHGTHFDGVIHNIIHELAQSIHLPKLKTLTLDFGSAHLSDLLELIIKHGTSLQSLHLHYIALSRNSWTRFLLKLADATMPELDELSVRYLQEAEILHKINGTYGRHPTQWMMWPIVWTTDLEVVRPRLRHSFPIVDGLTSDELLELLSWAAFAQYIKPFGQVGAERLRWMAANLVEGSP